MNKLAALVLLAASACATDGSKPVDIAEPKQVMPVAANPSFTLYISNQSLDNTLVDMHVYIDDALAVQGDFDVFTKHSNGESCGGGIVPQHNWYEFKFALPAGPHVITVASDDVSVTLEQTVMVEGATKFGVLDYWFDGSNTEPEPEHFQFVSYNEQPYFD